MDNASFGLFDNINGDEYDSIPARIKYIRKEILHLTQKELAEKLGISQAYLSQIESGDKAINAKTLYLFEHVCHINSNIILGVSTDNFSDSSLLDQLSIKYQLSEKDQNLILWFCSLPEAHRNALCDAIQVLQGLE